MAKQTSRRASLKPSEAEKGGGGLPVGASATVTEAEFGTWEEAGEKALKFGRKADDPALILTCEVEGVDEPMIEFLGAGKGSRLTPSDDGEYLDIAEGSSASAISDSSNTNIFLASLCDKKKQGKMALDEDDLDNGISKFLVGLEFVVGRMVVERNIDPDEGGQQRKPKPSLVAEEITKKPSGKGGSGAGSSKKKAAEEEEEAPAPKRRKPVEDEAEEEPAPKKKKPAADDAEEFDADTKAEELVVEALGLPKHRKGLSTDDAFGAVYALAKADESISKPQQKLIMELLEDEKWLTSKKRAWTHEDGMLQAG